jgi:hypothetical protein
MDYMDKIVASYIAFSTGDDLKILDQPDWREGS